MNLRHNNVLAGDKPILLLVTIGARKYFIFPSIMKRLQTKSSEGKEGQEFPLFMLAEAIYMSWFTFELLVRLVS